MCPRAGRMGLRVSDIDSKGMLIRIEQGKAARIMARSHQH
jgi:hypothetical protein